MNKENRVPIIWLIIVGIAACVLVAQACPTPNPTGEWKCTVYEPPLDVVWLKDYKITVYGGVSTPTEEEIKSYSAGNIEVGVDIICSDNKNIFYRVRGIDGDLWFGWINERDIIK